MIGGTDSNGVVRRGQVQDMDMDIIKEVVVHVARGAPPMDGAGKVMGSEIVYT